MRKLWMRVASVLQIMLQTRRLRKRKLLIIALVLLALLSLVASSILHGHLTLEDDPHAPLPRGRQAKQDRDRAQNSTIDAPALTEQRLRRSADRLFQELQQLKSARSGGKGRAAGRGLTELNSKEMKGAAPKGFGLHGDTGGDEPGLLGVGPNLSLPRAEPCPRHSEFRVAMLLPWATDDSSARERFPPWLPFFVATARRSASLFDWLIFHEGGPVSIEELPTAARSPNVRFVNLGSGGLAHKIATALGRSLHLPTANVTLLGNRLRYLLSKWPRLIAEYKPAFGSIFQEELSGYTHWGFSDLDVMMGDVARFVSRSELRDYHIVTYSFGDQEALYLRGQWTVHRNHPSVNAIWRLCEHLGHGMELEVARKLMWERSNEAAGHATYRKRVLSAEGCYSHRALLTRGVRVKIAQKQFAGLESSMAQAQKKAVFVIRGALWLCDAREDGAALDVHALAAASNQSCDAELPEVHIPRGEKVPLGLQGKDCATWVPREHRLCAEALSGQPPQIVSRRDGVFFAQRFEPIAALTVDRGRCQQGALFHAQDWKRRWDARHIDGGSSRGTFDTFRLDPGGIRRFAV